MLRYEVTYTKMNHDCVNDCLCCVKWQTADLTPDISCGLWYQSSLFWVFRKCGKWNMDDWVGWQSCWLDQSLSKELVFLYCVKMWDKQIIWVLSSPDFYWRFAEKLYGQWSPLCVNQFKVVKQSEDTTISWLFRVNIIKNTVGWVIPLYEQVPDLLNIFLLLFYFISVLWCVSPCFCVKMCRWTKSQWVSSVKFRDLITSTCFCTLLLSDSVLSNYFQDLYFDRTEHLNCQYTLVIFIVGVLCFQIIFHFFCVWVS